LLAQWNFSYYPLKLIILTFLVTLTWLSVTFLTKPDNKEHLKKYVEKVKPSGWWPKGFVARKGISSNKLLLLFIYALVSILPFIFVWVFKFYSINFAFMLVGFWLISIWTIIKKTVQR